MAYRETPEASSAPFESQGRLVVAPNFGFPGEKEKRGESNSLESHQEIPSVEDGTNGGVWIAGLYSFLCLVRAL